MATASFISLCIEASRKRACIATMKPPEKSVHQKILDNKYRRQTTEIPLIISVAVFCGIATPGGLNKNAL